MQWRDIQGFTVTFLQNFPEGFPSFLIKRKCNEKMPGTAARFLEHPISWEPLSHAPDPEPQHRPRKGPPHVQCGARQGAGPGLRDQCTAALQGRLPATNAHRWPSWAVDPPSPGDLRTGSWTSGGDLQTGSRHFDLESCNPPPRHPHRSLPPMARHRDRGEVRRHLRFGGFSQSAVALDLW